MSAWTEALQRAPSGRYALTLTDARGFGGAVEFDTPADAPAAAALLLAHLTGPKTPARGPAADRQVAP